MSLPIPTTLAAFTPEFVSEAFAESGAATGAITDVHAERIAVGDGFLGELARLTFTYADGATGPATAIAKIPTTDEGLKPLGVMLGVYDRECRFYGEVGHRMKVRHPACYYNGHDLEAEHFALLLEDVGSFRAGDHVAGASLDDAKAAMAVAASIHGRWWDHDDLAELDWVPPVDSPLNMGLQPMFEASFPAVMDTYGHLYSDQLKAAIEDFIPNTTVYLGSLGDLSRTLVHNDFRLDNIFFDDDAVGDDPLARMIMLDWQLLGKGDGSGDFCPFLSCNLDVELRRAHEVDLLRGYHENMRAQDAGWESFDDLMRMYVTALLFWTTAWGNTCVSADEPNERATQLFEAIMTRTTTAATDHEAWRYGGELEWRPN